jgi:hypothetical protein
MAAHSPNVTTFSYYKSSVDYSKSVAVPIQPRMLFKSRDSPGPLSSIFSGEGLYEKEYGGSQLALPLPCFETNVVKHGAEPDMKGKGSAEPYLMVQLHPAPPFIVSPEVSIALVAISPGICVSLGLQNASQAFRWAAPPLCSCKSFSKEGVFVLQSGTAHFRR